MVSRLPLMHAAENTLSLERNILNLTNRLPKGDEGRDFQLQYWF